MANETPFESAPPEVLPGRELSQKIAVGLHQGTERKGGENNPRQ
jgi:hypothetical protein